MTSRSQKGCSGAPESGSAPYRRGHAAGAQVRRIHIEMPAEPPMLTPGAARALLRILRKARARPSGKEKE
jgi:hypothetical protein